MEQNLRPVGHAQLGQGEASDGQNDVDQITDRQGEQQMVKTVPLRLPEAEGQPPNGEEVHSQPHQGHGCDAHALDPKKGELVHI